MKLRLKIWRPEKLEVFNSLRLSVVVFIKIFLKVLAEVLMELAVELLVELIAEFVVELIIKLVWTELTRIELIAELKVWAEI